MTTRKQNRSARNDSRGRNQHRKAGLPAKAGRRKPPITPGPHVTNPIDRARGARLARCGVAFYKRPENWIDREAGEQN